MLSDDKSSFIPTRAALKIEGENNFQILTYKSHKASKRKIVNKPADIDNEIPITSDKNEFNMKRVRHEIIKFGMSGFDPQKKEEAKIQLAIKLGAKPPKNKYKNYKILQEERAKQKAELKKRQEFQQLGKNAAGKSTAKGKSFDRKRKKKNVNILDIYGKVDSKNV